ncbi:MAG: SLC13 family permease [Firmicutes bacterium]|nr:SLC13 family permease [Bacillota bacterium]MDD4263348.1 SLC13 family permease [Bacillota bacterium]MDD4694423.1 SLC13 family permease [Bacillota bacterium]
MNLAILLFVATYILLLSFPKARAYIALLSAALFVALGILPVEKVFSAVDWNVILMIAGTMGIVALFIESKMPSLLADLILEKVPNVKWAIISLSLFAGIISAFVDNVATVLMIAPVAMTIAKKLKISPVLSIIAIAISSNLQGAATLVGDTTSILLGGYANLDFLDFFVYRGKPGLFWVVEIGALAATLVLLYAFRKETKPINAMKRTVVKDYYPTVLLAVMIVLLILASFIPNKPSTTNGMIATALFLVGLIRNFIKTKDPQVFPRAFKEIDYFTILLLAGLFVIIAGITEAGVIDAISQLFVKLSGDNLFVIYTLIVWASVLFSAFIDNIPYVATMLPVTKSIAGLLGFEPHILYFGLLIGATLGGNLTPIGASANITALGILRKDGYEVKALDFMKISVPFTLAAVTTGYILTWLFWA